MHFFRIALFAFILALVALPCAAKIYKYQKDGVWYYTDSPPREKVIESETMVESGQTVPPPKPGGTLLLKDYPRRSAIEMATAATVAVKGGLGYGSGFFISTDGYILTNKHVIRTTEKQHQSEKKASDVVDGRIEDLEKKFADEKKQMAGYAADLKQLKHLADSERDRARKKSYKNEYAYRLKRYATWKADYKKRHQKFLSEERTYRSQRADYNYKKSVANLSKSFAIILADNTELNVRLVATSADHDLALLKLDGYKTPALEKVDARALIPGGALYAIGNPARLTNSVTSGVFPVMSRALFKPMPRSIRATAAVRWSPAMGGSWGSTPLKKSPANSKAWGLPSPFRELSRSSADTCDDCQESLLLRVPFRPSASCLP